MVRHQIHSSPGRLPSLNRNQRYPPEPAFVPHITTAALGSAQENVRARTEVIEGAIVAGR